MIIEFYLWFAILPLIKSRSQFSKEIMCLRCATNSILCMVIGMLFSSLKNFDVYIAVCVMYVAVGYTLEILLKM